MDLEAADRELERVGLELGVGLGGVPVQLGVRLLDPDGVRSTEGVGVSEPVGSSGGA